MGSLMQGKEDDGRYYLNHELMANDLSDCERIPYSPYFIEQPTADKKETRQTQQEQHLVECHIIITETEHTDMRINYENHGKSSHRINILYPILSHSNAKIQKNSKL